jgi:hypothetical protein
MPPATTPPFAGGRILPPLLFVTNSRQLAANIGAQPAAQVIQEIRDAGQTLYDVQNLSSPHAEVRSRLGPAFEGVVILGGYDILPAQKLDVLDPALRSTLGAATNDADNFIIWSDDIYGDRDGDGLPEVPVSRIPDAQSAALVAAALHAGTPAAGTRFGIRNHARPFAENVYTLVSGSAGLLVSEPTPAPTVAPSQLAVRNLYFMLHGSDADGARFWGEQDDGSMLEAASVANIPKNCGGVVFAGCCWGALTVGQIASRYEPGQAIVVRTPESSIALSFLQAGALAFVGCTGTHYSPTVAPYQYFGGPMHQAFWNHYNEGVPPAKALFQARIDYLAGMPHGQIGALKRAIERKILKEYTCLGLGW